MSLQRQLRALRGMVSAEQGHRRMTPLDILDGHQNRLTGRITSEQIFKEDEGVSLQGTWGKCFPGREKSIVQLGNT